MHLSNSGHLLWHVCRLSRIQDWIMESSGTWQQLPNNLGSIFLWRFGCIGRCHTGSGRYRSKRLHRLETNHCVRTRMCVCEYVYVCV